MNPKYEKLKNLLKELFQLDQPDLDFGIYRIMHARSKEITKFLDNDLLPQVQKAFARYQSADKKEIQKQLDEAITQAKNLGVDPEDSPKVKELHAQLASATVDRDTLESEVYDHLYSFFRRYYSEGDFISKRVYKEGVYAIPYEGEEVKLYWANYDQYYIKTSEYLRDYAFRLKPNDDKNPLRVHFRLVDAAEGEHNNVKEAEGKNRVFVLAGGRISRGDAEDAEENNGFVSLENDELVIRFEFRPATLTDWPEAERAGKQKPPTQKELIAIAEKRILTVQDKNLLPWIEELKKPQIKADGTAADYSRLVAHLNRYTARNTFDYFIHKDLGGFLNRELDFYIKNEVMHLDDIENENAPRVEQYLSKIKVIRSIAKKIIDFLAQLENFQKKLWLKKKFVVETNYCITLDRVPEEFYPEIAANQAQIEEWVKLFAIDEIKPTAGDLPNTRKPGYSVPLTVEFLKAHNKLVLDTRFFSEDFKAKLIASIDNFDEQMDGLLIHSENFQALNLLQARYKEQVKCVYIDPPFNLGQNGDYLYRTDYKDSTWATLLYDRIKQAKIILSANGIFYLRCDYNGNYIARSLINQIFGADGFQYELSVQRIQKNVTNQGKVSLPIANDSLFMTFNSNSSELANPYLKLNTKRQAYWRRIDDSAGYRNPPERIIFGKVFYPYKRDAHFKFSQKTIDAMIIEKRIALFCKNSKCGYIHTSGNWTSCPKCGSKEATPKYLVEETDKMILDTNWTDIAGYSNKTGFATENAEPLLERALNVASFPSDLVADYFAGSGTTLAVALKSKRKWLGVEMGNQFDDYIIPRLKKECKLMSISHCFKYIRLESYEDTLNNLELRRTQTQTELFASVSEAAKSFKEDYILHYMLDVESRGSASLLNTEAFMDPTAYKLKVKIPGSDESRIVTVDLIETFNYLLGLQIKHIAAPQRISATFERDSEQRLRIKGILTEKADGPWWFRTVTGTTLDGRKILVIWRNRPGGESPEGVEQDNLVLDEWFKKMGYSSKDRECDLIYVNGTNNLENLKTPEDQWKVRLIEEDFKRLMFEETGV